MSRCYPFANSVAGIVKQGCWMNTSTRTYTETLRLVQKSTQRLTHFPISIVSLALEWIEDQRDQIVVNRRQDKGSVSTTWLEIKVPQPYV